MAYNLFGSNRISRVERLNDGSMFYELHDGSNSGKGFVNDREKLRMVLCNPAALRVIKMQCDMYSLGVTSAFSNDKELDNDILIDKLNKPNPFQTGRQFKWDYMFNRMVFGTAYMYSNSKVVKDSTNLYWLNPSCFEWTKDLTDKLDKIALSNGSVRDIQKLQVKYRNADGSVTAYNLADIKPFFDLSNGFGNWYKGASAIDALYQVIINSGASLRAKNSNLDFSGKFMVFGKNSMDNINEVSMGDTEKISTERSLTSSKDVHVIKSPVDIKRFVENIDKLKLDESYFASAYKMGSLFGIPRDVLEADIKGSTFENQKMSKGSWIEQSISPSSNDLDNGIVDFFNYPNKIKTSYEHLSFMQVFREQKQQAIKTSLENIKLAQDLGLDENEAKRMMNELLSNK